MSTSTFDDVLIEGVATQESPATQPQHLVRLAEALGLLASIFTGDWDAGKTYTANQIASESGSWYLSKLPNTGKQPSLNPAQWRLAIAAGANGVSCYPNVAFASDAGGTGFSLSPGSGLNYVAFKFTASPIASPSAADFTGLWKKYVGADGAAGANGTNGQTPYFAFASDNAGTGFSLTPGSGLTYIAFKLSATALTQASDFAGLWKQYIGADGADGAAGADGQTPYFAFASDNSGTDFSLSPGSGLDYIAFKLSAVPLTDAGDFAGLWQKFTGADGADGTNGADGQTPYFAFASDTSGTGFSLSPGTGLNYIAVKLSATALTQASDFAGLWKKFVGADGAAGANGTNGQTPYFAFASDASGTGFSLSPGSGLNYIAIKLSATALTQASDFTGLWRKYIGTDGSTGATGNTGAAGASAFIYIGYASDNTGTGFSLTASDSLQYIAIKTTTTAIVSPQASDFAGLWKLYGGSIISIGGGSPLTLTSGVLAINASSANTANYVVQRDGSGNFSAGQITATSLNIAGSATITWTSSIVTVNQPLKATAMTIGTLSGVLKATAGLVAGSATTDDLTVGTTNLYFTQALARATVLTGLSSTNVILATDTILSALGKIDTVLGGAFPTGTVSGNLGITGNLAVTGTTTLGTLSGVLKATAGVVAGSATTDDLAVGSTNLYWTQTLFNTAIAAIKNVNSGICPLDSSGKVPLANLYAYGATPFGAASQSAMLALSSAKQGDFCLRSDTNLTYVLQNNTPATLANWIQILYPVMSVNGATGTITLTTDNIGVGSTNLYWTQTLFNTAIAAIKGANSGICPLDSGGLVPGANLPALGNSTWTVNSQSAQTNLTTALKGDLALRTDQSLTYVLSNNTPTSFGSWLPLLYPVTSVNGSTGVVVLTTTNVAEGSNLYFTGARAIAATLTGYTSGAGTVASTDTILQAIQKLNGNIAAIVAVPLAGGAMSGPLTFTGTSNRGLVVNQLSTGQINSLATTSGFYGNIVYDTSLNQLKALVNGSFVSLSAGASLPLSAGTGSPLTGQLNFQDGLTSNIAFGSVWNCRTSSSNANFDILQNSTVSLTIDSSNNVHAPNGYFDTGSGGGYKINGNTFANLASSRLNLDWGGTWTQTTNGSYADWQILFNGSMAFSIAQSGDTEVTGFMKATSFKVGSQQVMGARQTGWTAPTGSATRSSFDTSTVTLSSLAEAVKALIDDFITHGAIGS